MAGRSIRVRKPMRWQKLSDPEKVRKGCLNLNRRRQATGRMIMAIPMWK